MPSTSTPAARFPIPASWIPADLDNLPAADQVWCDSVKAALADLAEQLPDDDVDRPATGAETDSLEALLRLLVSRVDLLASFRGWRLALAAERGAEVWMRASGLVNVNCSAVTLTPAFRGLEEGWEGLCSPPVENTTREIPIESIAQLESSGSMSDTMICSVFHDADPRPEDVEEFGPWMDSIGPVPSPNYKRLAAAREGKAIVPKTKTIRQRAPNWPALPPALVLLSQMAVHHS